MTVTDALHDQLVCVDDFALMVRTTEGAKGLRAVRAIARALEGLPATPRSEHPWISLPAPLPDGPIIRVGALSDRGDTRRRAAEAIRRVLEDHDLDPGAAAVLAVDGLADLDACRRAVVLRLFPEPGGVDGTLESTWIDVAAEWVFGDQRADAPVRMRILGVERAVPAAEAAGLLHGCARARAWCDVVTGDVTSRIRTASLSFGAAPHVAIGGGGPRCDDDGLLGRYELLREVALELADEVTYSCLDFEDTFARLGTGLAQSDWSLQGGAPSNTVAGRLVDRFVPEAFPLQVLGPEHVDLLRAADTDADIGQPVGHDRWVVTIGDAVDWLPASEVRDDVRQDGWDRLRPLLLRAGQLDEQLESGSSRAEGAAPNGHASTSAFASNLGVPDLYDVVIDTTTHARRGTRLTVLELASWFAGEPHGDAPRTVSPVVSTFARNLAAGLDHDRRQQLKWLAPELVGTGPSSPELERRRAWRLTDWLLRTHAPPWLRLAGLTESAERLDRLPAELDNTDLVRAVDLLGSAIVTASRRLETTASIAGPHRVDLVDQIAWDVWELAAERTGWIAASEAAAYEVPPDLAYAADQRVVECSRDPRMRAELEAARHGLGDAIWSAALHEIGHAAWQRAWEAMDDFVYRESTFSIRTVLRRSLESGLAVTSDDVVLELLFDEVDHAARDALARVTLAGEQDHGTWDRALVAVRRSEAGRQWWDGLEETRRVLGDSLFDDALEVGRAELVTWLERAPGLVARAVATSVAREAAGVAGRGVAARAAAQTMAGGGGEVDAEDAAQEAVRSVVELLADDGFRVLESLVTVSADADVSHETV